MQIEEIKIDGLGVRHNADEEHVYLDGGTTLTYDDITSLLTALGIMGFDLRGYTARETISMVGEDTRHDT